MLINANKARSMVEEVIKAQESEEMKEIEELITGEINKGNFTANFYGELKNSTKTILEGLGYTIRVSVHYNETNTIIKW